MTPSPAINKSPISAHTIVSCTTREGDLAKFWPVWSILADSMAVARQVQTPVLQEKIEKSGRGGGVGMGTKSGQAHALGCPEWVPPGAGLGEGVLGMLWWFSCPSGPMHAIHADTDSILTHTCRYIQIHTDTYIR